MIIKDAEFGEVIVRKNAWAKSISFSVHTSGRLQMTVPSATPNPIISLVLKRNCAFIREKIPLKDPSAQRARDTKKRLLTKKAKNYLPYRVEYFAKLYGYHYDSLVFKHQKTRWGSCTHRRERGSTSERIIISLNIGLMQVPEPLRDYVIIHELAHINHPDHSAAFWAEVGEHDPRYKAHRAKLKQFNPGV